MTKPEKNKQEEKIQKLNDDLDKFANLHEESQQRISDLETQLDMESEKVSFRLRI